MADWTGLSHIDLTVTDPVASAKWYNEVLGTVQVMDLYEGPTTRVISVAHPTTRFVIGLIAHSEPQSTRFDERAVGLDHIAFLVNSRAELDELEKHLTEKGVEHSPIKEHAIGHILVFRDPDNIQLEFWVNKNTPNPGA